MMQLVKAWILLHEHALWARCLVGTSPILAIVVPVSVAAWRNQKSSRQFRHDFQKMRKGKLQ